MRFTIIFLVASLFALCGFTQGSPFSPENFNQLRIAHRGGYAYGPENTLEAICNNIRTRNIQAMEIDLQMTSDGYLVLFHDETLAAFWRPRTTCL